ncbi:MAG TPA: SAM-dependent chlorinase/fluorinase [Acidimicrobiales bacterium]|nr:SAM-dependent chlorinase/fluorinase [Acidimicrobiales bacterium]
MPGSVFLLTDFGNADEFAGIVRAVLAREAPGCPVVDLTHEVPQFDVRAGALSLERAIPHLGPGVVVAVVDPGVGTERRALAVSARSGAGPASLVGPDNGLLCFALDALGGATEAVELHRPAPSGAAGATFDGRDLFAPSAARLCAGTPLEDLGKPIDPGSLVRLPPPRLEVGDGAIEAEVLWIDRFGNVQLAARPADADEGGLRGELVVVSAGASVVAERAGSFTGGGSAPDALRLITDSNGRLALVCPLRSAATVLGVEAGDVVRVSEAESSGGSSGDETGRQAARGPGR